MKTSHKLTPAQLRRIQDIVAQQRRLEEVKMYMLGYIVEEAELEPSSRGYVLSEDLTAIVPITPKEEE